MTRGWSAIDRAIFDHEMFEGEPYSRRDAWVYLFTNAAWSERTAYVGRRRIKVKLQRGQLIGATQFLADKWGWGRQKVRSFLTELAEAGMITITSDDNQPNNQRITTITVCNFDVYQNAAEEINHEITSEKPANNQSQNKKQQKTTITSPDGEERERKRPPPPIDPLEVFEKWNVMALEAGLPQVRSLTPARRKSVLARTREHGAAAWDDAWRNIRSSEFLTGQNDRGWTVDFDFLIGPRNFPKVVEGKYNRQAKTPDESTGVSDRWQPDHRPDWVRERDAKRASIKAFFAESEARRYAS